MRRRETAYMSGTVMLSASGSKVNIPSFQVSIGITVKKRSDCDEQRPTGQRLNWWGDARHTALAELNAENA